MLPITDGGLTWQKAEEIFQSASAEVLTYLQEKAPHGGFVGGLKDAKDLIETFTTKADDWYKEMSPVLRSRHQRA